PDGDYYLVQDEKSKETRQQYVDHMVRMFKFIGVDEAKGRADAEKILALETKLAAPRLDKIQSRDARNFNNPRSVAELQAMTPAVNWNKFIKDLGITKKIDTVIVMEPKYMAELNTFLKTTPIEDLKTLR